MAREFFCIYHSYRRSLQNLNDAEIGRLIRALLEYSEHGTAPDLPGKEQIAFDFMAANIDREIENYNAKINALRENGKKGGRPPKVDENQKKQMVFSETKKSQEEKEEEDEEEKDVVSCETTIDGFASFWDAYPRKVNKAKAIDAWRRLKPSKELQAEILRAVKAWSNSDQWTKDGAQYIPHPATWLNGRRWEDELPTPVKRKVTDPAVSSLDTASIDNMVLRYTPTLEGGQS